MSNPNDPAYPTGRQELVFQYDPATGMPKPQTFIVPQGGMTIRQRFVMAAMQAQIAFNSGHSAPIAEQAIKYADAALAEEARTRSKA